MINTKIYRFKVYNYNKILIYQCVTTTRQIHEIIEELDAMYKATNKRHYIHCNNELVYVINPPYKNAKYKQRIRDKRTGYIFVGLWEFMEDLGIKSKAQAYDILKNDTRYDYVYKK